MSKRSVQVAGLLLVVILLISCSTKKKSTSTDSTSSTSGGTATYSDVSSAFTGFSQGMAAAMSGATAGPPSFSPAHDEPSSASPANDTAVVAEVTPTDTADTTDLRAFGETARQALEAHMAGTLDPLAAPVCNADFTNCTYTNGAGTVKVVINISSTSGIGKITFTNYSYTGIVINGTVTESLLYANGNASGTFAGTLNVSGAVSKSFSIVFAETQTVTSSSTTCGGTITADGVTYTVLSTCAISK